MDVTRRRFFGVAVVSLVVAVGLVVAVSLPAVGTGSARCERLGGIVGGLGSGGDQSAAGFDYESRLLVDALGHKNVYVTDFNNDRRLDLLAVGGGSPVILNNTGDGFERSGALAGVDGPFLSALALDHNTDGWEDILLLSQNGSTLLENHGGSLQVRPDAVDLSMEVPLGAAAADYDGDGTLDVFVIGYENWYDNAPAGYRGNGTVVEDNGNPNRFLVGNGTTLTRVDHEAISGDRWSMATSFVDLTGDDRPDVHVANDFNNDVLYVNDDGESFDRRTLSEATDRNQMSSEIADVNGDGRLDIFVTNIYGFDTRDGKKGGRMLLPLRERAKGNNLLINQGNGTFVDRAASYGVRKGGWGWAAILSDMDNDADEDIFQATQIVVTREQQSSRLTEPMVFERVGEQFVTRNATRSGFEETDGRGVAELDYDRDGDIDIVVASAMSRFYLYENTGAPGNSVEVRVTSATDHTAIGAEVYVTANGTTQYEVMNSEADFKSQDTRTLHFGLGDTERVEKIRIVWPDGTERTFEDVRANQFLVVDQRGVRQRTEFEGTC